MSFYLNTKEECSDTIYVSESNIYENIILKKLKKEYKTDEAIIEYLEKIYLKINNTDKLLTTYVLPDATKEEINEREISSYLYEISRSTNLYLNSVLFASSDDDSFIANILILMFNVSNINNKVGKNRVFDKEATVYLISELGKAFDSGLIEKSENQIIDFSSHKIDLKDTPLYSFYKKLKENDINDFVYFQHEDSAYCLFEYYSELKNLSYKDMMISPEFISFIEDSDYTNDDFEDMNEIFESFVMSVKDADDIGLELINAILHNKDYKSNLITKERIENISFDSNGVNLFNILKQEV